MAAEPAEYIRFLNGLHQVRNFLPMPVPNDALEDIFRVARWTGTAANKQHWQLIVVRDRANLEFLGGLGRPSGHLAGAAAGLLLVMQGDNQEWLIYDEGRLAERIMLAAHAHGLGAGIGWIVGEKVDEVKQHFGLPSDARVRTAISLGYTDQEAHEARPPRPEGVRKPLSEFIHYERF